MSSRGIRLVGEEWSMVWVTRDRMVHGAKETIQSIMWFTIMLLVLTNPPKGVILLGPPVVTPPQSTVIRT